MHIVPAVAPKAIHFTWKKCLCSRNCKCYRPDVNFIHEAIYNFSAFDTQDGSETPLVIFRGHGRGSLHDCVGLVASFTDATKLLFTHEAESMNQLSEAALRLVHEFDQNNQTVH